MLDLSQKLSHLQMVQRHSCDEHHHWSGLLPHIFSTRVQTEKKKSIKQTIHFIQNFELSEKTCNFPVCDRCFSKNILFYLPVSGTSNLVVYEPLVLGLAQRGHQVKYFKQFICRIFTKIVQVTVVTSFPLNKNVENVTQIIVNTPSFLSYRETLSTLLTGDAELSERFQKLVKFYRSIMQVKQD